MAYCICVFPFVARRWRLNRILFSDYVCVLQARHDRDGMRRDIKFILSYLQQYKGVSE